MGFKNLPTNSFTTFSEAYILYEGEWIDISTCILGDDKESILSCSKISDIVRISNGTMAEVKIIKDGKSYVGEVTLEWPL